MSTEAVEGTGLPVSADAGIAEAAVFRVSPGYFLRQIYPLDPAGGRTRQLAGGLRAFADACADGGVASVQRVGLRPGSLAVTQVADERCAVNLADGKSLLGAHSCTNAHLPIMPDLTGLGSVSARPRATLTLSELCFTVREVFFSFGPHTHHEPVGRRVATIDLRIARVRS